MSPFSRRLFCRLATATIVPASLAGVLTTQTSADAIHWNLHGFTNGVAPNPAPGVASTATPGAGEWNTSASNWTTAAVPPFGNASTTTYAEGDDVTFHTGTAVAHSSSPAVINIQAVGVTPGSVLVTGASTVGGNYFFTGGPIQGATTPFTNTAPVNTSGAGPAAVFQAANTFGGGLTIGNTGSGASAGSLVESQISGSLGTGLVVMRGGNDANGSWLRFAGPAQTHTNDFSFQGGTGADQRFQVSSSTGGANVTLTGSIQGNDDDMVVTAGAASKVLFLDPAAGKDITGTGNVRIEGAALRIRDAGHLFDGNLILTPSFNSVLILDGVSWSQFARGEGTGAGQYQFANRGANNAVAPQNSTSAGFAAKGQTLTINSGDWDRNFSVGHGDLTQADGAVIIDTPGDITFTAERSIRALGGSSGAVNSNLGVVITGPIHEVRDAIKGNQIVNISGLGPSFNTININGGGNIRLSNAGNQFSQLRIGIGGTVAAIFSSQSALGGVATVEIGAKGLLMFEDADGGGEAFTQNFTAVTGTDGNINNAAFGAYAGNTTWTGSASFIFPAGTPAPTSLGSVGHTTVALNVLGGASLSLGDASTAATLDMDRQVNYGAGVFRGARYVKNDGGELILRNLNFTGDNTNGHFWRLQGGTLTSWDSSYLVAGTDLSLGQLMGAGAGDRRLNIRGEDHAYTNVVGGTWIGNFTVDVETGLTFSTTLASGQSFVAGTAGAQTLTKTGGGTWVINSPVTAMSAGEVADAYQVDAGTLDVRGNTGLSTLRLSGGTLLVADVSGFAQNHATNNRFEIDADGGKLGISPDATANVTRGATAPSINSWTQGGTVTFASRNDFSLLLTSAAFPDITAGAVLFERDVVADATPTGFVQINDTAVAVSGASTRVGGSGAVRFGATGTGTWTFNDGTLAPGSSPGILTIDGNIALTSAAAFEVEINGVIVGSGYDRLVLTANAARTIALGNAELVVALGYAAAPGDTFTIIDNQRADNLGTGGLLSHGGNPLAEGDTLSAFFNGDEYGFTISYIGGTGNDVVLTSTGAVAIPEPGSLALLALGGATLLRRRR